MKITEIKSEIIDDKYIKAVHKSGINIYIYPALYSLALKCIWVIPKNMSI